MTIRPVGGPRLEDMYVLDDEGAIPVTEEETSLVEHVILYQAPQVIDYYSITSFSDAESIECEILGRRIKIFGINQQQEREDFNRALAVEESEKTLVDPKSENIFSTLVERVIKYDDLKSVLATLTDHRHLEIKRAAVQTFDRAKWQYLDPQTVEAVLKEEVWKIIQDRIPIKWKIPKEKVKRLWDFIQYDIDDLSQRYEAYDQDSLEAARKIRKTEAANLELQFADFREVKDYYLEEDLVTSLIIPLTKRPFDLFPRAATVKRALRNYFQVEDILIHGTPEMWKMIGEQRKLPAEERRRFAEKPSLPKGLNDLQKRVFTHAIKIFLPLENELLMAPVESIGDEIIQLEQTSKLILERICLEARLEIVFRQSGKEVHLGMPMVELNPLSAPLEDEEEACDARSDFNP